MRCKATLASTRRLGRCRRALCPVLPRGARARLPAAVVPATGALSGRPLPRSRAAEFRLRGGVRRPAGARPPRAVPRALRPAARDTVSEARHVTSSRTWDLSTVQEVQCTTRKTPAHHRRPTRGPDSCEKNRLQWTVESRLSAMLTSMSYKGSPLPPCKWCARRSASLSHSPSWRSSRSHSPHVETPCHHSASRSRTHPSSQRSLRPLQGTAPRPRAPRCASRAAPASSTLPTTLSSCDGRPPLRKPGRAGLFDTTYVSASVEISDC